MAHSPASRLTTPVPVTEFRSRFLFPFYFDRGAATIAADKLIADRVSGSTKALWVRTRPRHLYIDEFLDHVVKYLFPNRNGPDDLPVECEYLKIVPDGIPNWFRSAELTLLSGRDIQLDPSADLEVFLTSQGVGVLSIILGAGGSLDGAEVLEFNYRLSQFRRKPVAAIVKRHPADDPAKFNSIQPDARANIAPKPSPDASIDAHLTSVYGTFTLEHLVRRLIHSPLNDLTVRPVEPKEMAVYTVVRLTNTDFANPENRTTLAPLLSGLTQIEESGHPGTDPDELSVPAAVMNCRHWAAVGVLGSAHLVADEVDEDGVKKPFNDQRVGVVLHKYFVSFLVTLLQRMTLNRAVDEAAEIFHLPVNHRPPRTACLRQDLLRFGVGGQFSQINSRHAHHRYYQLCRTGLDVVPAWQDIRGLLAEMDADRVAKEQADQHDDLATVAKGVAANVTEIERLQSVVHMIEFLLGTVYGAHFLHMAFAENHTVYHWLERLGFNHDGYVTAVTFLGGALGFLLVYIIDRFRQRHSHTAEQKDGDNAAVKH